MPGPSCSKLAYLESLVQLLQHGPQAEVRPGALAGRGHAWQRSRVAEAPWCPLPHGGSSHTSHPPAHPPHLQALPQVYELLEAAIDGTECNGEQAAQQLDLLPPLLLADLRCRGQPASLALLGLLGTLCEKRDAAADELRAGGALASVAQHLLQGEACRGRQARLAVLAWTAP